MYSKHFARCEKIRPLWHDGGTKSLCVCQRVIVEVSSSEVRSAAPLAGIHNAQSSFFTQALSDEVRLPPRRRRLEGWCSPVVTGQFKGPDHPCCRLGRPPSNGTSSLRGTPRHSNDEVRRYGKSAWRYFIDLPLTAVSVIMSAGKDPSSESQRASRSLLARVQ